MKKYVVTFAHTRADSDLHLDASRHRFDRLKDARDFADRFKNAYITAIDGDQIIYVKCRSDLRFKRACKR